MHIRHRHLPLIASLAHSLVSPHRCIFITFDAQTSCKNTLCAHGRYNGVFPVAAAAGDAAPRAPMPAGMPGESPTGIYKYIDDARQNNGLGNANRDVPQSPSILYMTGFQHALLKSRDCIEVRNAADDAQPVLRDTQCQAGTHDGLGLHQSVAGM